MNSEFEFNISWMRIGGICGILSISSYLAAAFVPMPDTLSYVAAFAFGPLLAIGTIGLYYGLSIEKRSPLTQIAALFGVGAGFTVLSMLTVQQAIFAQMKGGAEKVGKDVYQPIFSGLNSVHFGLDIAWDVLISSAVILFGISMLKNTGFGKILGVLGILFGSLLISFNLWSFPNPPINSGSIDWGPAVALWLIAVFTQLLRVAAKYERELQEITLADKAEIGMDLTKLILQRKTVEKI